ncbi:MAG: condensation domain-containing protein, partial [Flammeovirgaceae bacterium]
SIPVTNIPKAPKLERYPLSYAQKRLWILDRILQQRSIYNISSTIEIKGNVHFEHLQKAFRETIERHEVLRTNFVASGIDVFQSIRTNASEFSVQNVDLTGSMHPDNELRSYV